MINQILNEAVAISKQQDNERRIAAAEQRRLARAARRAGGASTPSARAVAPSWPRLFAIGPVAAAWRALGRGLAAGVGRGAPA